MCCKLIVLSLTIYCEWMYERDLTNKLILSDSKALQDFAISINFNFCTWIIFMSLNLKWVEVRNLKLFEIHQIEVQLNIQLTKQFLLKNSIMMIK